MVKHKHIHRQTKYCNPHPWARVNKDIVYMYNKYRTLSLPTIVTEETGLDCKQKYIVMLIYCIRVFHLHRKLFKGEGLAIPIAD